MKAKHPEARAQQAKKGQRNMTPQEQIEEASRLGCTLEKMREIADYRVNSLMIDLREAITACQPFVSINEVARKAATLRTVYQALIDAQFSAAVRADAKQEEAAS